MTTASDLNHFKTQALLEQKFQEYLDLVGGLQEQLKDSLPGESGFQTPWRDYVLNRFREFCPKVYKIIGDTLFQLIQLLQPADCRREERIKFYYWPVYHSYLADRRIFIRRERWNVGVGICAVPYGSHQAVYGGVRSARQLNQVARSSKSLIELLRARFSPRPCYYAGGQCFGRGSLDQLEFNGLGKLSRPNTGLAFGVNQRV